MCNILHVSYSESFFVFHIVMHICLLHGELFVNSRIPAPWEMLSILETNSNKDYLFRTMPHHYSVNIFTVLLAFSTCHRCPPHPPTPPPPHPHPPPTPTPPTPPPPPPPTPKKKPPGDVRSRGISWRYCMFSHNINSLRPSDAYIG